MTYRFAFLLASTFLLAPASASAQATLIAGLGGTAGYGTLCLGENDDGSSNRIDLATTFPGGLRFFSMTHTSLFVNTNGNITFSGALPTFTPAAFPVAARPMIAPFWADVDTRRPRGGFFGGCTGPGDGEAVMGPPCMSPAQNGIWWHLEPGRMIVTWDRVGYYLCHDNLRMSFQLILTAAPGCAGAGDFDVEFRFNRCDWETGDASGGTGGFGGTPAQSGFDAGDSTNFVEIAMSRTAGIARRLCTMSNVSDPGVWRFQIRSGTVMCPEAGMPCDTMSMGVCAEGRISCDCSGATCTTRCVPQVSAGPERCNALDDDCDGSSDEGMGLCPGREVCDMGVCVEGCFEGGCPVGETCTSAGICVESACVDMMCPEGQRCVGGSCVGACDGVSCPAPLVCRGGRCVDACSEIMCDECTVCEDGSCITRCDRGAMCMAGETCAADGRCIETACDGVMCGVGTICRGGTCVDTCMGAMCPTGQMCVLGECVPAALPDGGRPMPVDGGGAVLPDAGPVTPGFDGGMAVLDANVRGPRMRRDGGCGCHVPARSSGGSLAIALGLGLALALARRRRRG